MIDVNFETIRNKILDFSNYELDPEYKRRLEEYHEKIENDFQVEWSKKKFKWFFKKRRQQKLRARIAHRYSGPVFWLIEDIIEDLWPKQYENSEFFGKFVDVKDLALGDKNYCIDESIVDKFNSYGCPSFRLTKEELERRMQND